jgi:MerR family transcriptional regulator, light-induced transcriptional regulator
MQDHYSIKVASKLSGVPEITIRAWERRYKLLEPVRSKTNRRIYSEEEVEKLILFNHLIRAGYRIGNLANHTSKELHKLYEKTVIQIASNGEKIQESSVDDFNNNTFINAIKIYEEKLLLSLLNDAATKQTQLKLMEKTLVPLIQRIGDDWKKGELRVSHEHFAGEVIKKFLGNLSQGYKVSLTAPRCIIATPEGQYHELGGMMGGVLASSLGWKAIYLGASLGAEEIAGAAKETSARCILLSIVYPNDSPNLPIELRRLRNTVGVEYPIIVFGSAIQGYTSVLEDIHSIISTSPEHFISIIENIRRGGSGK